MVERSAVGGERSASLLQLGLVEYGRALDLQHKLVRLRQEDAIPDTLVILEHPPVITLGKHADRRNLLVSEHELQRRGVSLYQVERGGDITFHGPGQLVGYPVFKLGNREEVSSQDSMARAQNPERGGQEPAPLNPRTLESSTPASSLVGVRRFVELVEQALVLALAELGIKATTCPGYIGVWVGDSVSRTLEPSNPGALPRKIASLGIAVRRGVTMHGFALNVTTDLSWFRLMNPCGLDQIEMTSVEREGGETGRDEVRAAIVHGFEQAFELSLVPSTEFILTFPSS